MHCGGFSGNWRFAVRWANGSRLPSEDTIDFNLNNSGVEGETVSRRASGDIGRRGAIFPAPFGGGFGGFSLDQIGGDSDIDSLERFERLSTVGLDARKR